MSNYFFKHIFLKDTNKSSVFLILRKYTVPSNIYLMTENHSKCKCSSHVDKKCKPGFKPVTHVIFDLDGTLLGTDEIYNKVVTDLCKSYGKEFTDDIRAKILGITEADTMKILLRELHLENKITEEQLFKQYMDRSLKKLSGAPLMPGAKKLIEHFHKHKIPLALATSSLKETVDVKIAHFKDLFNKFSHMVMGSSDPEVKHGKPAPDIFLLCASRFKPPVKPEKCLVFEDAPNGVLGGLRANMQVVAIRTDLRIDRNLYPKNTTILLDSLEEFKPELFGLPPYN